MLGHLAEALAGGLAVDVPRLLAAAQLGKPQIATIAAGVHPDDLVLQPLNQTTC